MPGGYGKSGPWGSSGTTSPRGSYSAPGGNVREEGSNRVADAINISRAAPPQISASLDLQNQAQLAISQENIHRGIGKYAGQFGEYDMDQPMATGYGSVFGASSGSTASSQTVQDVLNFMIDDEIKQAQDDKGGNLSSQEHNQAVNDAMANYYPKTDQMTLEEYLETAGLDPNNPNSMNSQAYKDWLAAGAGMAPGYANLMEIPEGHIGIEDFWTIPESDPWNSWEDPWYGGHTQGEGYDDSMSDMARHYWFSESLDDVSAREAQRKEEGLGVATMMDMEQMYDRNFAAKANPMVDPRFSEFAMFGGAPGTTAAEDIMYSKGLFETART